MTLIDRSAVHDPSWPNQVDIYDTTLRDGSQLEGISLTVDDKLRIAEQLDRLGEVPLGHRRPARILLHVGGAAFSRVHCARPRKRPKSTASCSRWEFLLRHGK